MKEKTQDAKAFVLSEGRRGERCSEAVVCLQTTILAEWW